MVTWQKITNISAFERNKTTKLDSVVVYDNGLPHKYWHGSLTMWSCEVTWQLKSNISQYLNINRSTTLMEPNVTRWWLVTRGLLDKKSQTIQSHGLGRSRDIIKTLYLHTLTVAKLYKVAKNKRTPTAESYQPYDPLVIQSHMTLKSHSYLRLRDKRKIIQLNFCKLYYHQIWQTGDF